MENIVGRFPNLSIISVHTAELGLSLAEERKPDIIILDVNLPGMDGIEAVKHLKQSVATKDIPVIALSANAIPEVIKQGRQAGFIDFLTKPIKVSKLIVTLRDILEEKT